MATIPTNLGTRENQSATDIERDIRSGERWLIGIGVATLVINTIIALIYYGQLKEMRKATQYAGVAAKAATDTLNEVRAGSTDTHKLAEAADTQSKQAIEQTQIMGKSITKTDNLVTATNRLANSSDIQSRINAKELELSERPWVFFDASITSPLTFDSSGARVGVRIVSRNTGHSPAAGISWQVKIIPFIPAPNAVGERERICKETEMQQAVNERTSYMLFPGGDIQQDWVLKMDRGDIERTTKVNVGFITPTVIACVVYHPTFKKAVYRTARIYNVFTIDPHTGATFPIKAMENGTVPIEIGMFQHFAGGIYGD